MIIDFIQLYKKIELIIVPERKGTGTSGRAEIHKSTMSLHTKGSSESSFSVSRNHITGRNNPPLVSAI